MDKKEKQLTREEAREYVKATILTGNKKRIKLVIDKFLKEYTYKGQGKIFGD